MRPVRIPPWEAVPSPLISVDSLREQVERAKANAEAGEAKVNQEAEEHRRARQRERGPGGSSPKVQKLESSLQRLQQRNDHLWDHLARLQAQLDRRLTGSIGRGAAKPGATRSEEPSATPAQAATASSDRLCPVCEKRGLPPGRSRHLKCENASRPMRAPIEAEADVVTATTASKGERYRVLVRQTEQRESSMQGRRGKASGRPARIAAARRAVLLRSGGHCENPGCAGQPEDLTDSGDLILEVDHIEELAAGGRDHPSQMIALCPNCHAVETRGRSRAALAQILSRAAGEAHARWFS